MVLETQYEDTQLGDIKLGSNDETKMEFRKHFDREDEHMESFYKGISRVAHRRLSSIPKVISILPEENCGEDEKLGEGDIDLVDELMACLDLLESHYFEDSRHGIERLMNLANYELVNSIGNGSIAQALVCGDSNNRSSERLRSCFLTYFCHTKSSGSMDCLLVSDSDSSSSESGTTYSEVGDSFSLLGSLKVPTTRILASSLELVCSQYKFKEAKLDLSSEFWTKILASIAQTMECISEHRIEASLSIKCIRLLRNMEPTTIDPFLRYSLMPFIVHAREFGTSERDLGLVRESELLLDGLE